MSAMNEQPVSSPVKSVERVREEARFHWFAAQVRPTMGRYSAQALEALFRKPPTWPGQREKALVLLALDGSPEALKILDGLEVEDHPPGLRMLHIVALENARLNELP